MKLLDLDLVIRRLIIAVIPPGIRQQNRLRVAIEVKLRRFFEPDRIVPAQDCNQVGGSGLAVDHEVLARAEKKRGRPDQDHEEEPDRAAIGMGGRAGTKVGLSDPVVPSGRAIAQRIKATLGITG